MPFLVVPSISDVGLIRSLLRRSRGRKLDYIRYKETDLRRTPFEAISIDISSTFYKPVVFSKRTLFSKEMDLSYKSGIDSETYLIVTEYLSSVSL